MDLTVRKFLSKIGKKGRKAVNAKYGKEIWTEWGKQGGRPRKIKAKAVVHKSA